MRSPVRLSPTLFPSVRLSVCLPACLFCDFLSLSLCKSLCVKRIETNELSVSVSEVAKAFKPHLFFVPPASLPPISMSWTKILDGWTGYRTPMKYMYLDAEAEEALHGKAGGGRVRPDRHTHGDRHTTIIHRRKQQCLTAQTGQTDGRTDRLTY